MPQSTSTRALPVSSRNCDPVTVVAPPRNASSICATSAPILPLFWPLFMFGPILAGTKVTLRPARESDAECFVRWFADVDVLRHLGRRMAVALYQEQDFLRKIGESKDDVWWMIDAGSHPIGATGIHRINWLDANGTTGIVIGEKDEWRKGNATEAMALRTRYAFRELNLHKLMTEVEVENVAIRNTAIEGSRGGTGFAAARDGEIYRSGDLVRANTDGRAVLTFFDGSSLSVDPGSAVKVTTLNRVPGEGIQVTIEQTLGRSWSAVQKLRTPDSRYEMKTPSTSAAVRGTGFLTLVQPLPTGGTQTTYQVDEGTLQVTANAGGVVTVPAGTQVTIAEGAAAPAAPTPIPPSPRLEIGATTGLSFLAVSPSGAACGPAGSKSEIFGCVATGDKISIRDPAPGRWGLY